MSSKVSVRFNNVDFSLEVLKRKVRMEGIFRIYKTKRYFETSSEKKMRKRKESMMRAKKKRQAQD
ncbi:30S ribosomal protein S21 [Candidatus Cyrtobacter comes]|uniref:Small ribosomal subunit protein bS21 n=1 Tax=Candidatus Cyrtobacter comes TaxID=675776 RepID=A0ABU5L8Y8_9RICK|nr:30S ribosomal protein S21 [Candidatus Cyrtobacter comes]